MTWRNGRAVGRPRVEDNWTEDEWLYFCDPAAHRLQIH